MTLGSRSSSETRRRRRSQEGEDRSFVVNEEPSSSLHPFNGAERRRFLEQQEEKTKKEEKELIEDVVTHRFLTPKEARDKAISAFRRTPEYQKLVDAEQEAIRNMNTSPEYQALLRAMEQEKEEFCNQPGYQKGTEFSLWRTGEAHKAVQRFSDGVNNSDVVRAPQRALDRFYKPAFTAQFQPKESLIREAIRSNYESIGTEEYDKIFQEQIISRAQRIQEILIADISHNSGPKVLEVLQEVGNWRAHQQLKLDSKHISGKIEEEDYKKEILSLKVEFNARRKEALDKIEDDIPEDVKNREEPDRATLRQQLSFNLSERRPWDLED